MTPLMKAFLTGLLAFVLALWLCSCSTQPQIIYKDRVVTVNVPVSVSVDPRLTQDTVPAFDLPATGPILMSDMFGRLSAVEDSLTQCRSQLGAIRKLK